MEQILLLLRGNAEAGRVVPRSGTTVWLTVLCAAAMTFLAALTVLAVSTSSQVAKDWSGALALSVSVQVPDTPEARERLEAILQTSAGIAGFTLVTQDAQRSLLEPLVGDALSGLALPALYTVQADPDGLAIQNLGLRLTAELPEAVLDDNGAWRRPMVRAAEAVGQMGRASLLVVLLALVAVVVLAVEAVIAANRQTIATLRLIGATDQFIVRAFVRQITLCAGGGAIAGICLALVTLMVLAGWLADVVPGPGWSGWLGVLALVPLVAGLAFVATRMAAFRLLRRRK